MKSRQSHLNNKELNFKCKICEGKKTEFIFKSENELDDHIKSSHLKHGHGNSITKIRKPSKSASKSASKFKKIPTKNEDEEPTPQRIALEMKEGFEELHKMKKEIEILFKSQQYIDCILLITKCHSLGMRFYSEDHIFILDIFYLLGESYLNIGNFDESIFTLENILSTSQLVTDTSNISYIANIRYKTYNLLAAVYINTGEYTKAIEKYELSEKEIEKKYKNNQTEAKIRLSSISLNLGISHVYLTNFSIAEKYFRKGQNQIEGIMGNDLVQRLNSDFNENLGLVYDHIGKSKEAIVYYKKSLKYKFSLYGASHHEVIEIQYKISCAMMSLKQYKEADDVLSSAVKIVIEELKDINSNDINNSHSNEKVYRWGAYFYTLGVIYLKQIKRNEAKESFRTAEELWVGILNKDDSVFDSLRMLIKQCEKVK